VDGKADGPLVTCRTQRRQGAEPSFPRKAAARSSQCPAEVAVEYQRVNRRSAGSWKGRAWAISDNHQAMDETAAYMGNRWAKIVLTAT
jgi:hypothetical protein